MIPRQIQIELDQSRREYPVICITGPRQSGKTTLSRSAFPDHAYVSFEEPLARDLFNEDPKGFLSRYRRGGVFDEVQQVPDLFSYLQVRVDEDPASGRFVLTGSQHFGLTQPIGQSLAGRTAILDPLPFAEVEIDSGGRFAFRENRRFLAPGQPAGDDDLRRRCPDAHQSGCSWSQSM